MGNLLINVASSGIGKVIARRLADTVHQVFGTFNKNDVHSEHPSIKYYH